MSLLLDDINKIKELITSEFRRNFTTGVPKVPPHQHNKVDNLPVQSKDIIGGLVTQITAGTGITVSPTTGIGDVTVNGEPVAPFQKGTYYNIQTYTPSAASTATLDLSKGNLHHITMPAGNITIAISNGHAGQCFLIRILQDSVGSRTVTWFTTINWAGGSAPTLTTTASKADSMGFEITATNTYDGFVIGQNI